MGGSASKPEDILAIAQSPVNFAPPLGPPNPVRPCRAEHGTPSNRAARAHGPHAALSAP